MVGLYSFSDNWQLMFLPIFLTVFWLLFVLKNLSSFRKEFQNMDRKERSSELGQLQINDLKKKYFLRSIIGLIACVIFYVLVYFIYS
ncbi:hypothetical protein LX97_02370 [Nonlabens dokdonensis]|jgi:magnesium-transporting ATPase (P-type)|uniref:DUF3899 domain-containing protein n=3 Tax=Nonlabens dokdonensis TaxID=328515 RepID=L7W8T1_NONDD|nr:hypothetical protein DDD_0131 [Nonlabens dokdonensis DSW-6]PZX39004.1 hypothetical protein LX97_02370 [Nonlabens dokdonensis]